MTRLVPLCAGALPVPHVMGERPDACTLCLYVYQSVRGKPTGYTSPWVRRATSGDLPVTAPKGYEVPDDRL